MTVLKEMDDERYLCEVRNSDAQVEIEKAKLKGKIRVNIISGKRSALVSLNINEPILEQLNGM